MEPPADDGAGAGTSPPSAIAVGVVALLILGGALVAWLVPLASVVLVWPILFFVPGWVVVRRVVPDLPRPGAVGAAVVISVYASAHLVNLVARPTGFGREAIIISAILLATAALIVALVRHRWLAPLTRPTRAGVVAALRDDAPAWIVAAAAGLAVLVVLGSNGWHETPDGWVAAAGTGATSSSTSRSARASPPATSRPRSPTSPAFR